MAKLAAVARRRAVLGGLAKLGYEVAVILRDGIVMIFEGTTVTSGKSGIGSNGPANQGVALSACSRPAERLVQMCP
jgi:hypothetical protein